MKSFCKLLSFILIVLVFPIDCLSQNDSVLKPGYANVAVLIVDYDTYTFEGGNMSYYTCSDCNNDSLPFSASGIWDSSDDFEITFKMDLTSDTVFNATTLRMAFGHIYHPIDYSVESPFTYSDNIVQKPFDIEYIGMFGIIANEPEFIANADSAWNIISGLEITNIFNDNGFKCCIFSYAPCIGLFDPTVAKWLIFLYCQEKTNSVHPISVRDNIFIYPNPVVNTIIINREMMNPAIAVYKITDMYGKEIMSGNMDKEMNTIDVEFLPKGLYIMQFLDRKGHIMSSDKVIKG